MTERGRIAVFVVVILSVWTLMHAYVASRVWGLLPPAFSRSWLLAAAILLWLSYPLGRILAHFKVPVVGYLLELSGAIWMGALFLALLALLVVDGVTGFGFLLTEAYRPLRLAALGLTAILSLWGLVQGLRCPAVKEETVLMRGLPKSLDGLCLVQVSDLHLGTLMGRRWLGRLADTVSARHPDLVLMTGDILDGGAEEVERLRPQLGAFHAPLGVWAVTGNHEFYVGLERSVAFLESCGIIVLRDTAREVAPGLVLAGVDDLTARREFRKDGDAVEKALATRPEGATVFLSHSPLEAEKASHLRVGLMLSGHTHNGQIWPFGYLVRLYYPRVVGRYAVGEMTLLVSRGTGTWGPPMRLFARGEVTQITLRAYP